jgi:hypothetical protein
MPVGVPDNTPVDKDKPVGSVGLTVYVRDPTPPVAVTIVTEAAENCVSAAVVLTCVTTNGLTGVPDDIVKVKDLDIATGGDALSCTVTVKDVKLRVPVGVPDNIPFVNESPAGKVGLTLYVRDPTPPVAVTIAVDVDADCVNDTEELTRVTANGTEPPPPPVTSKLNVTVIV